MRATDLAWAAGLIDGEGCIAAGRNNGRGGQYVGLHVAVQMCDGAAVKRIGKIAGVGTVRLGRPFTYRRRPLWKWRCSSQEAASFLQRILPYMTTKRTQARWFIRLAARMKRRQRRLLTEGERRAQDKIIRIIKREKLVR